MSRWLLIPIAFVWALPYTLIGSTIGLAGLLAGGKVQRRGPVLEFHSGPVCSILSRLPNGGFVEAMTLGFAIWGRNAQSLDRCRRHEMVHVRQYAIWGPFFGPAYLLCSLYLWTRGRDAYRQNPFEVQAYAVDDCRGNPDNSDDG